MASEHQFESFDRIANSVKTLLLSELLVEYFLVWVGVFGVDCALFWQYLALVWWLVAQQLTTGCCVVQGCFVRPFQSLLAKTVVKMYCTHSFCRCGQYSEAVARMRQ